MTFGRVRARPTRPSVSLTRARRPLVAHEQQCTSWDTRRSQAVSLNRGAVILAVAAWQIVVEETTRGIVDTLAIGTTSPLHKLIKADASSAIGRFNTPNRVNSLDHFARVGLDPAPTWGLTLRWVWARLGSGATITKSQSPTPAQARFELDAWNAHQVRYSCAPDALHVTV